MYLKWLINYWEDKNNGVEELTSTPIYIIFVADYSGYYSD